MYRSHSASIDSGNSEFADESAISPTSRTPLLLALLIFVLALAATFGLWQAAQQQAEREVQTDFDFQVRQTTRRLEQRMATYEQVMRGTQAFLLGSLEVRRTDLREYIQALRLQEKFPGIQGLAIVQLIPKSDLAAHIASVRKDGLPEYVVHPAGERDVYSSILHIEPFSGLNLRAIGFDMLTNPVRRAALERSRDTGEAAASGKVKLIQENGLQEQSGLVMYLPVYRRGQPTGTVEQRRTNLIGWVGAPFRMNDLMAGLGGERANEIDLTIYDGDSIVPEARLFHSHDATTAARSHTSRFSTTQRISVAGRPWTLESHSGAAFEQRLDTDKPRLIGLAGLGASVMLALIVWTLASGRRRALALATAMTGRLRASEFRWKYALEGAGDGVWDWDSETGENLYSQRWKAMLGYTESELKDDLGTWQDLLHPEDAAKARAVAQAWLDSHEAHYANEFRMRCKDGSWKWILARGMAVRRNAAGKVLRTIGTHTDITAMRDQDAALRESNQRLAAEQQRVRVILDSSHDAFIGTDPAGRVTDWNAKAESMFGWSAAEATGRELGGLIVPPALRSALRAGFSKFAATGQATIISRVVQLEGLHRDGHLVPLELAIAGYPAAEGFAVSVFVRDISERKEAERMEAIRTRDLNEAREALQHAQKLEAVGKLTGGVAHDFNNVLQVISGNVHLLKRSLAADPKAMKRLTSMMSAVDHGAKLSSQLLAFARRQPLQPVVLNVGRAVRNIDDLLQRALDESVRLHTVVDPNSWNTLIDPSPLENVLLNLALNARDAMPNGGTLTIEVSNVVVNENHPRAHGEVGAGEYVLLALSDTGTGMSADVMAQAFEPFFTTKPAGKGTGLGLSMAYGFIKQSGGHILIYSELGHGTTIKIYLPRSLEDQAAVSVRLSATVEGGNETILVVEDDLEVQASVAGMLAELGYQVLSADEGESALRIINSGVPIDLLLTDVVMPGALPGPLLARRAREILPQLKVLFTSGFTRNALISGGRLDEGVQLLSKPYQSEQLAQKIRQVLSS